MVLFASAVRVSFFQQKTAYEMRISDWSSDVCSSEPPGALRHSHISRGCLATAKRLSQTVIAGLDPAVHAGNRFLTSLERFGAAAEWALGTSPRVTSGIGGGGCAIAADDVRPRRGGRGGRAAPGAPRGGGPARARSEEHTSEL